MPSLAERIRRGREESREESAPPLAQPAATGRNRPITAATIGDPTPLDLSPLPDGLPPAAVCQCGCPSFWTNPYRKVNCLTCRPPKVASQVRRRIFVLTNPDGSFAWEDDGIGDYRNRDQQPIEPPANNKNFAADKKLSFDDIFISRQLTPPPGVRFDDHWAELAERSKLIEKINCGLLKKNPAVAVAAVENKRPAPPAETPGLSFNKRSGAA